MPQLKINMSTASETHKILESAWRHKNFIPATSNFLKDLKRNVRP
jgi:hypothetical protein